MDECLSINSNALYKLHRVCFVKFTKAKSVTKTIKKFFLEQLTCTEKRVIEKKHYLLSIIINHIKEESLDESRASRAFNKITIYRNIRVINNFEREKNINKYVYQFYSLI